MAMSEDTDRPHSTATRRRRWPWVVAGIAIAIVGVAAWLGSKALIVRNELVAAQLATTELRTSGDVMSSDRKSVV